MPACRRQLFASTMWVMGIEPKQPALVSSFFINRLIFSAQIINDIIKCVLVLVPY